MIIEAARTGAIADSITFSMSLAVEDPGRALGMAGLLIAVSG